MNFDLPNIAHLFVFKCLFISKNKIALFFKCCWLFVEIYWKMYQLLLIQCFACSPDQLFWLFPPHFITGGSLRLICILIFIWMEQILYLQYKPLALTLLQSCLGELYECSKGALGCVRAKAKNSYLLAKRVLFTVFMSRV